MRFGSLHLNAFTEMAWVDAVQGLGKGALITSLSIRRFWKKGGREWGKCEGRKTLTLPTPPFETSSPLTPKEGLILRLTDFLN